MLVAALSSRVLLPLGTLSPSRSDAMNSPAHCPATTASPPLRASRAPLVAMAQRGGRGRRLPSSAPEAEQPEEALARILRTEAAVSGVSRKAAAASGQQSTCLWPRAVLEALDSAVASCRWESALEIFELMRKQRWYEPKAQTYARLLMMLGRCRQPGQATALFNTMLSEERLAPRVDVYTALVSAYGNSGMLDEALAIVDRMKGAAAGCKPDEYTFSVLINCCCKSRRFDLIPAVLDEMAYLGLGCNVVIHNGIIDGYGKAGKLEEMENALSNMLEGGDNVPDIYTMNSILWAYGDRGRVDDMEKWYGEFQLMGVEPDTRTFNIMMKSYGKADMPEKMMSVLKYMKQRFFSPSAATFNIIIDCFGRAGNIEKMEYYFRLMKIQGMKPNPITYCSLVNGYSKAGLLDMIPGIVRQTENTDVVLDTPFFNCVISAYAKAGEVKIMEEMLQFMKDKNCKPGKVIYTTMIQAYIAHGMDEAAKLLELEETRFDNKLLEQVSEVR
ncbi:pentatricopeptide repeat-containing protein At3g53170-like [Lolium rigidum]|uniref:pentatricopeptide repeat-containing protein At3g53170-like n=1 Tax=Lolium rigidum TaxID=89674 RepID=UPI001F5C3336|nr:pentatricopeptide repeat-containing protein At3g53170-like [Lolium rigidum]XP_051183772.1 pentatricopeptide repeat-containing protein At3g53170 [Lolium perenne]XP_051183773.1 pentatricopeptide repeat-containing protein At3g53170 [Lolium perenne]XP_051183774.1 pentatricopeptide repeat-containing protein At3g53170 [Lolium perenne]XP_051183775.1 pentatricopeptide repeat-containing protein At3g53170 [Lolium perenne]XP_051183776.1 pentatricopeptide repeat-containing protein At3g53170 [Lolium per